METLIQILSGKQPLDTHLLQGDAFLDLVHLLEFLLTAGFAFYAARKLYRRRLAQQPHRTINRAEDSQAAFMEAKDFFIMRMMASLDLLMGVICALVSLFMLGVVVAGMVEHADRWWQELTDCGAIVGIGVFFGICSIFLIRRAVIDGRTPE